ncbi:uncharacterized protein IAS62_005623 [Cryptococcus decagattii]|uniref:Dihydroxy-acid dehydratase n=1 Tax=Cryptococcus decagattii TaxID=1859122 RepID=A0ABZ2B1H1_9TREE
MLARRIAIASPATHARAFHASATKASKEVIMNRYSRTITQPKAQGASQCLVRRQPRVKKSLINAGIIGYQFGTVGVSDGISMVSYSLQSRDLIADSVETAAGGHWLDGMVVLPGCDKNMPGTLIALGRLNRPSMMVYGGTIRPGSCNGEVLDIVSAFQSYGRYLQEGQTPEAEKTRYNTIRNACPGPGACGGMYTANTIASASEALGMTLPGSSSFPAEYPEKHAECDAALTMALGGSTNVVLHLIAIARSVGINLTIDDFQAVSDRVPLLADLKPSGKYVMEDINTIGGTPSVIHYLIKNGLMTGDEMTITGKTLGENCDRWVEKHGSKWEGQKILRPLNDPLKSTGHIRILRGNLAPGGSVSKITGKEGLRFTGKCRAFDDEESFVKAVESGSIKKGEKTVVVLRYLGPKGGPAEEAQVGGPIALVQDGDIIHIDAVGNTLSVDVSDEEMARRKENWVAPPLKVTSGTLLKYARAVTDASHGCVTDA